MAFVQTLLALVEYFLLINFQKNINQDVIDILGETNSIESAEFLETYLTPISLFCYVVATILCSIVIYYLTRFILKSTRYVIVGILFVMSGFITTGYSVYGFIRYREGKNIPQLTTLTRAAYALYITNENQKRIERVCYACENLTVTQNVTEKPTIIVIIGESHSIQHSSLYGYGKQTNLLLEKYQKEGSLIVFDNATCVEPFTTASVTADYSLDSLGVNFDQIVLFPACFKKAGYHTELYDNQYFAGEGLNLISSARLSKILFDVRNTKRYQYDEDMVKDIQVKNTPSLYIIHLWGQHYTYKDRYPASFEKFNVSQY